MVLFGVAVVVVVDVVFGSVFGIVSFLLRFFESVVVDAVELLRVLCECC